MNPQPNYGRRAISRLVNELRKARNELQIVTAERDQLRAQLDLVNEYSKRSIGMLEKVFAETIYTPAERVKK